MEGHLRQETQKENEAHNLMNNVRSLLLVAEQALERGMSGEEFDFTNRVDLMAGINAGKAALRVVGLMEAAAVDEAVREHQLLTLMSGEKLYTLEEARELLGKLS